MRTIITILLGIVALVLSYLIYNSIRKPLDFEKAKKERYDAVIQRLKDIRKVELAYKDAYGKYTGSWDTLIGFVMHDKIKNVRKVGELTDSMAEAGLTEKKALALGLIKRDTIRESVLLTLFDAKYDASQLKMIPGTTTEFFLGTNVLSTASGIPIPVFEARAHNNDILKGLDAQLIINLNDQRRTNEKYPGLKVGSLTETNNNAGNWE